MQNPLRPDSLCQGAILARTKPLAGEESHNRWYAAESKMRHRGALRQRPTKRGVNPSPQAVSSAPWLRCTRRLSRKREEDDALG